MVRQESLQFQVATLHKLHPHITAVSLMSRVDFHRLAFIVFYLIRLILLCLVSLARRILVKPIQKQHFTIRDTLFQKFLPNLNIACPMLLPILQITNFQVIRTSRVLKVNYFTIQLATFRHFSNYDLITIQS